MRYLTPRFRSEAFHADRATTPNPLISIVLGAVVATGALLVTGVLSTGEAEPAAASGRVAKLPRIFELAEHGTPAQIREAVRLGEFVNAVCPELIFDLPRGCSPLMVAARFGRSEVVAELRNCGAMVNARAQNGWTALHVAALFGHEAVVETLALAGERLETEVPMSGGSTAAELAAQAGNLRCAERIASLGAAARGSRSDDGSDGVVLAR